MQSAIKGCALGTHFVWCATGTVLSPLLFSLYINDITVGTESEIRLFKAVYTLEGTVLKNVDNIKYIGVTISTQLAFYVNLYRAVIGPPSVMC